VKKLEIKVNKLKEIMELVKPVVPKKPTVKSIACLCMGSGKAVATDLETMVIANLPEAQEPMLLPYSSIAEMLKYVPGSDTLKVELKGKIVFLSWSNGSASYQTEDFADFPILPDLIARAEALIDGDILIPTMVATVPYTADDDTRPVLSGITVVLGSPYRGRGRRRLQDVPQGARAILPSGGEDYYPAARCGHSGPCLC